MSFLVLRLSYLFYVFLLFTFLFLVLSRLDFLHSFCCHDFLALFRPLISSAVDSDGEVDVALILVMVIN